MTVKEIPGFNEICVTEYSLSLLSDFLDHVDGGYTDAHGLTCMNGAILIINESLIHRHGAHTSARLLSSALLIDQKGGLLILTFINTPKVLEIVKS